MFSVFVDDACSLRCLRRLAFLGLPVDPAYMSIALANAYLHAAGQLLKKRIIKEALDEVDFPMVGTCLAGCVLVLCASWMSKSMAVRVTGGGLVVGLMMGTIVFCWLRYVRWAVAHAWVGWMGTTVLLCRHAKRYVLVSLRPIYPFVAT